MFIDLIVKYSGFLPTSLVEYNHLAVRGMDRFVGRTKNVSRTHVLSCSAYPYIALLVLVYPSYYVDNDFRQLLDTSVKCCVCECVDIELD